MTDLPASWRVAPLGEVADTTLGKMLDRGKTRGLPTVPYLRNVNVQWGRIDTHDLLAMELADGDRERFAVQPGDLLVCEGGEIGRAAIWHGRTEYLAFQKALHRIRSRGNLDMSYLRYLLELYDGDGTLEKFSTGSTIAHLPQQKLRALPVPLPLMEEQRQIVDILEDHLSRLAAAASCVEAANRGLSALRRSALNAQFSGGGQARVPLRELVIGIEAGRSFGGSSHPAADDEWGILKVSAMTWGTFRASENKAIAPDRADPRYEIRKGDLLLSRANTTAYVGASVLVGEVRPRLLLSDKSLRIITAPDVRREWLWRALSAPDARAQMSAAATGTKDSMRNISQTALLSIELSPVPVADQQSAVARSLEVEAAIERLTADLESAAVRGDRLRRALLGAAFAGRLTGRAADMERVEEMAGV